MATIRYSAESLSLGLRPDTDSQPEPLAIENFSLDRDGVLDVRRGFNARPIGAQDLSKALLWSRENEPVVVQDDGLLYSSNSVGLTAKGLWQPYRMRERPLLAEKADAADPSIQDCSSVQMTASLRANAYTVVKQGGGGATQGYLQFVENGAVVAEYEQLLRNLAGYSGAYRVYPYNSTSVLVAGVILVSGTVLRVSIADINGVTTLADIDLTYDTWSLRSGLTSTGEPAAVLVYREGTDTSETHGYLINGDPVTATPFVFSSDLGAGSLATQPNYNLWLSPVAGTENLRVNWAAIRSPGPGETNRVVLGQFVLSPAAVVTVDFTYQFNDRLAVPPVTYTLARIANFAVDTPGDIREIDILLQRDRSANNSDIGHYRVIYESDGTLSLQRIQSWGYAMLDSEVEIFRGRPLVWVRLQAANPDVPVFGAVNLLVDYRYQEVRGIPDPQARAGFGRTSFASISRLPLQSMNRGSGGEVVVSYGLVMAGVDEAFEQRASVVDLLLPVEEKPALVNSTAIAAHAGYPRAYDGQSVFEHDWHYLPEIRDLTIINGGANNQPAATYSFAATYVWDDGRGIRYRSAPVTGNITAESAFENIAVTVTRPMFTARRAIYVEIWVASSLGDSILRQTARVYADRVFPALFPPEDRAIVVLVPGVSDVSPDAESLPQGPDPTQLVPSDPSEITDFIGAAGTRLWSVSPLGDQTRVWHTSALVAGQAQTWSADFSFVNELETTTVQELDGRITLGGPSGWAFVAGAGPSNTGQGSYPIPTRLPFQLGPQAHASTQLTGTGILYTTAVGTKLLTRNLQESDVASALDGFFRRIESAPPIVTKIVYDSREDRAFLFFGAQEKMLIWARGGRWHQWSPMAGSGTITSEGRLYITVGGQLWELIGNDAVDPDGPFVARIRLPWLRGFAATPDQPGLNTTGAYLIGKYLSPHTVTLNLYRDFNDGAANLSAVASSATVEANAANGLRYFYALLPGGQKVESASYEVSLSGTTGRRASVSAIEIAASPTGDARDNMQIADTRVLGPSS